jgi:Putative zinc-finger
MEHTDATRDFLAEKYLLGELTPELREQFEEHMFGCPECSHDVRTGASFIEHSKAVFSEPPSTPLVTPVGKAPSKLGLSWMRPVFAMAAVAGLLAVVGFQALFVQPALKREIAQANVPHILPSTSLITANSRGGDRPVITVPQGGAFLLFVDVPADPSFSAYVCELRSPTGRLEFSLPVSAEQAKQTLSIEIPPGTRPSGVYTLEVRGVSAEGATSASGAERARYSFELQTAKQ